MAYQDQTLKCVDCGADFVFTAGEQEFYAQKGFDNTPKRCQACRAAKKQEMRSDRKMFEITCSQCGKTDTVPFEPKGDRPVLCGECFKASRQ